MIIFKIAFRSIFRQKRRSILTALSMFGGFFLSAFFIGFSDGSYNQIISMFTRNNLGHIQIHEKNYLDKPSLYKTIKNYEETLSKISKINGVEAFSPRIYSAGIASVAEQSTGVKITGVDQKNEIIATNFDKKIFRGNLFSSETAYEVIVGEGLAKTLKASIGDELVVISQGADGSIANDAFNIVGISRSGNEIEDRVTMYIPLAVSQELLTLEGRIHEIAVTVDNLNKVSEVNFLISREINSDELAVDPWQVFAKSFYDAMQADVAGMWVMLLIIMFVVAIGVLNTVLMSVLERRREYGVLKAMGTKPGDIIKLILTEINILAIICVVLGSIAGIGINYYFSKHGISIPEPITYGGMKFQYMTSEINIRSFIIPAITVFLSATIVGFFPALKAAKTDPAKAMRTH
ncbi:MAG: FtsX-like permease family protein [Acidobacteriota bacterium]